MSSVPVLAAIGIGSNLANPLGQVQRAVMALRALPATTLLAVSPWYGSKPVGGPAEQPDYINGAATLRTRLGPLDLLDALQAIEQQQERERHTRWGARTLDLDLLLYGDHVLDSAQLVVPHPRLCDRHFVLQPLADIASDWRLPNGCTVASSLAALTLRAPGESESLWRLPASSLQ